MLVHTPYWYHCFITTDNTYSKSWPYNVLFNIIIIHMKIYSNKYEMWKINCVWKLCKNQLKCLKSNLKFNNDQKLVFQLLISQNWWKITIGYLKSYNNGSSYLIPSAINNPKEEKSWKHLMINNILGVPLFSKRSSCPLLLT